MGKKIAVIHDIHWVGFRIESWMLSQLGFEVYAAGSSFHGIVPNHHLSDQKGFCSGVMEFRNMPQDALFVDTHPDSIGALRRKGWNGPVLMMWMMPVGPEWVEKNFKPQGRVGSLAFSAAVGKMVQKMNVCPNDYFWPPYFGPLDQSPREAVGSRLITVIENAAGWTNVGVLTELRDDPRTSLELFGGAPPGWSRKIPQTELFARIRGSLALYHPKPFDTPGFAVMEAALQAVPIIFCPGWIKTTEWELFKHDESCLVAETEKEAVAQASERLKDVELNRKIGREGRRRLLEAADWPTNKPRLAKLIDALYT